LYPSVLGEFETVRLLLEGKSIARFGDGELKILDGRGYSREPTNYRLTEEMLALIAAPARGCLVGIPTMDPAGPKYLNWTRHMDRFCRYVRADDGRIYASAFITRPDSAADPIESPEYFDLLSALWRGQGRVAVVSETTSKILTCARAMTDGAVIHVECPSHRAYAEIDKLEQDVAKAAPSVALLSCGPTATCLANRLARRGIQGIDLGSIGGMLMRLLPKEVKQCD
jgi:hypothetical protein